jgi:hypothetical protein
VINIVDPNIRRLMHLCAEEAPECTLFPPSDANDSRETYRVVFERNGHRISEEFSAEEVEDSDRECGLRRRIQAIRRRLQQNGYPAERKSNG